MCVIYKHSKKLWIFIALLAVNTTVQFAIADDLTISPITYIPSFLNVDFGVDSEESREFFVFANLAISANHRFTAGYGEHDEIVRGSLEELDTQTFVLGYSFYSMSNYHLGVDFERWGDENKLTTDTISAFVSLDVSDFTFTFSPQYRQIDVFTESNCSGKFENTALAIDAKYFINRNWALSAGYATFDYKSNLDSILDCDAPEELPFLVARLKSVADYNQVLAGIHFFINTETIRLDWARIESALDGDFTYVLSAYASTDIFDSWTLAISAGTQENYDDTTTDFIKGSVTYYW